MHLENRFKVSIRSSSDNIRRQERIWSRNVLSADSLNEAALKARTKKDHFYRRTVDCAIIDWGWYIICTLISVYGSLMRAFFVYYSNCINLFEFCFLAPKRFISSPQLQPFILTTYSFIITSLKYTYYTFTTCARNRYMIWINWRMYSFRVFFPSPYSQCYCTTPTSCSLNSLPLEKFCNLKTRNIIR